MIHVQPIVSVRRTHGKDTISSFQICQYRQAIAGKNVDSVFYTPYFFVACKFANEFFEKKYSLPTILLSE